MKENKTKVVFTKVPQDIVDLFLDRVESAYRECDTICVITKFTEFTAHQEIHKLNDTLVFDYTLI